MPDVCGSNSTNPSRPALLQDIRLDLGKKLATPWNVNDNSLRPVPMFYPPLDPRCTAMITDSSPSGVAFRISDCLKKRSISVEYDEETNVASCMSIDRVHFNINLYRGNRRKIASDFSPDLAHAIIVEIVRVRGSTISFHPHNRAILNAAMGQSSGEDERRPIHTGPCEFPRFISDGKEPQTKRRASTSIISLPHALERALTLLKKDRIDVQVLGMESLVSLTDSFSSGVELSVLSSKAVLGASGTGEDADTECMVREEMHEYLVQLLQNRVLPGDEKLDCFDISCQNENEQSSKKHPHVDDAYHGGVMRSMALRVLANALSSLSKNERDSLVMILESSSSLTSRGFIQALSEDLIGGTRLPAVVAGTRLASAHEAALATRCLRILADASPAVQLLVANPKAAKHPTLDVMSKNYETTRHDALEDESQHGFSVLSREIRTC
eukprot:CAMPEP_0194205910 /NCGR_PEP_ID=MMETSP0156-20130528/5069_1 /TAXON_ID=33649 /ORGANISM="Thalassionema nitzschioides, Strain L26-B" /LENGTH=440 /DNA_ID=CAMNT_0038932301 /DNA_START=304 /DNA_END=1626 /DNA_ORIENTATION=+